jgi:DNA-binding helix-hairpin-helix protein with protein kinase domain
MYVREHVFTAALAMVPMVIVVLPLAVVAWLVFASCYYVFYGHEMKRRDDVMRRYNERANKDD